MFALSDRLGALKNAKINGILRLILGCYVASIVAFPALITMVTVIVKFLAGNRIMAISVAMQLSEYKDFPKSSFLASTIIFPILAVFVFFLQKFTINKPPINAQKILLFAGAIFSSSLVFIVLFVAAIITHNYNFPAIFTLAAIVAPVGVFCAAIGHLVVSKPSDGDIIRHYSKLLFAILISSLLAWFSFYYLRYATNHIGRELLYGLEVRAYLFEKANTIYRWSIDYGIIIAPVLTAYVYFLRRITYGKSQRRAEEILIISGVIFAIVLHVIFVLFTDAIDQKRLTPIQTLINILPMDIFAGAFCAAVGHFVANFGVKRENDRIIAALKLVMAVVVVGFLSRLVYYIFYFGFMNLVGTLKFGIVTGFPVYNGFEVFVLSRLRDSIMLFWPLMFTVLLLRLVTRNKTPETALKILMAVAVIYGPMLHLLMAFIDGSHGNYFVSSFYRKRIFFEIMAGVTCAYIGHIIVNGLPKISKPKINKNQNQMLLAQ